MEYMQEGNIAMWTYRAVHSACHMIVASFRVAVQVPMFSPHCLDSVVLALAASWIDASALGQASSIEQLHPNNWDL